MLKVTVETKDYFNAHGKAPKGHGWWIFEAPDGKLLDVIAQYGIAKQQAISWGKENGYTKIKACS